MRLTKCQYLFSQKPLHPVLNIPLKLINRVKYNPKTQETEAGESHVQVQPGLQRNLPNNVGYTEISHLKNNSNRKTDIISSICDSYMLKKEVTWQIFQNLTLKWQINFSSFFSSLLERMGYRCMYENTLSLFNFSKVSFLSDYINVTKIRIVL